MPAIKSAVFAATLATSCAALPEERSPPRARLLDPGSRPVPAGEEGDPPMQLSTFHLEAGMSATVYTVAMEDGGALTYWIGPRGCHATGTSVEFYEGSLNGYPLPRPLEANCSGVQTPMVEHQFYRYWDGVSETVARDSIYEMFNRTAVTESESDNVTCENLVVQGTYTTWEHAPGPFPLARSVNVSQEPCRAAQYSAADPAIHGSKELVATLAASLVALAGAISL